jgi:YegS/Rv2252/BmrU family lipid kinase
LIINTKSGPYHDSILRVREVVALLGAYGITADVRVKLRKKQARREARRAARAGIPLVIAAGGDGTVEAVAAGLVGTPAVLGIIPLGTYNNVAACLGIPTEPEAACALIGLGTTRCVDVGRVTAQASLAPGRRLRRRIFLEMGAVGLTAALMPVGQGVKKGAWEIAAKLLPAATLISPTPTTLSLDGAEPARQVNSLLVEVANSPRMGPAFMVAPAARMDDGMLDVAIYRDIDQAGLATRMIALKSGISAVDDRIERTRALTVDVFTATPLPVMADSKVIGTTPARFEILAGALRVVAGDGPGLAHPVAEALVNASIARARALVPAAEPEVTPPAVPASGGFVGAAAAVLVPVVGRAVTLAKRSRTLAAPAVLLAAGAAVVPLANALAGLRRNGRR